MLSCPNISTDNNQKIDSPTDICNAFNSFFANVGKKLPAGIKLSGKIKNHKDNLNPRQQSSISTKEFEVLKEIKNLSSRKSSSYIEISVDVLKHLKFIIASYDNLGSGVEPEHQ